MLFFRRAVVGRLTILPFLTPDWATTTGSWGWSGGGGGAGRDRAGIEPTVPGRRHEQLFTAATGQHRVRNKRTTGHTPFGMATCTRSLLQLHASLGGCPLAIDSAKVLTNVPGGIESGRTCGQLLSGRPGFRTLYRILSQWVHLELRWPFVQE